jgi:hypothetical protein
MPDADIVVDEPFVARRDCISAALAWLRGIFKVAVIDFFAGIQSSSFPDRNEYALCALISQKGRFAAENASMCDYSLHNVASRPARVGDELVTKSFANTYTRGFAAVDEPGVAVCVLPGTELVFEKDVEWHRIFLLFRRKQPSGKLVCFRKVNADNPDTHHDAVEFPNGKVVLLTRLREGQKATVLQLPAGPQVVNRKQSAGNAVKAEPPVIDLVATTRNMPLGS